MFGEVPKLFFGDDPGLELREQRSDRLESVELFLAPLPVTEFDETEHAGGDVS